MEKKAYRIAQIGTFDLKNYGDILFPDVLSTELSKYLNIDEIVLFSPLGGMKPFDTRTVLPISELEREHLRKPFDAVICGGGDLIRIDKQVVSDLQKYEISNGAAELWIKPILVGKRYHIPVLLNSPGVPFSFKGKEKDLVRVLLQSIDYVSVRDAASAEILKSCGMENIHVIPDSVFLVEQTYSEEYLEEIFQGIKEEQAMPGSYFIFQLNRLEDGMSNEEYEEYISLLEKWTDAECVMMPIGYVHQDKETLRRLNDAFKRKRRLIERELSPIEMLAIIRHAKSFIGTSMHGCLTAFALGSSATAINSSRLTKMKGLFSLMKLSECEIPSIRRITPKCILKKLNHELKNELVNKANMHMCMMAQTIEKERKEGETGIVFLEKLCETFLMEKDQLTPAFSMLYFDNGEGFSEQNARMFPFIADKKIGIDLYLPKGVKRVRFDPVEGVSSIISNLTIQNADRDITKKADNNGVYVFRNYVFETTDPQIVFEVKEQKRLQISADVHFIQNEWDRQHFDLLKERKMLNRLYEENGEVRARSYDELEREVQRLKAACELLEMEKEQLQDECDRLREKDLRLQNAYESISSSDMWRMTGPVRKVLDYIKNAAEKWKWSRLAVKAIRYCKRYGIKQTLLQIKNYIRNKNRRTGLDSIVNVKRNYTYEENIDFSSYQTDIKVLALYLPQFHEIRENNEWWGKGFTEWTNVKKGNSRFGAHNQPRVPDEYLGYYDLSHVEVLKKQVALAKQHGIYGFAMYYYWFSGHRLLEKPMDLLLQHKEIDFPFMAVWANENWTRTWDGKENSVLIEQKYTDEDAENFILDLKKYLDDQRYIRVDGKPVIGLYAPAAIPNIKNVLNKWRETANNCGIGEILIWICTGDSNAKVMGVEDFVDGEYEFPPRGKGFVAHCSVPDEGIAFDYKELVESARNTENSGRKIPYFRGSMMEWDNSARKKKNYHCWLNFTPERFYIWNRINVKYLRENYDPEYRFLFVNAWNEWGEGTYLEPDRRLGYACINALSKAIMDIPYNGNRQCGNEMDRAQEEIKYLGCGLGQNKKSDWDDELKSGCRIAVQAHIFYPELTREIVQYLDHIPYEYDLYVSTTDKEKEQKIIDCLKTQCTARKWQVYVHENKGRDVVPFLYQMKPVIGEYKYFCHIHTKKSLHTSNLGDVWRAYLYQNLLGSKETLQEILYEFETGCKIGVIFPENMDVVRPFVEWGSNRSIAEDLARRMKLDIQFPEDIQFPAGNMFWAKVDAVKNVFDVDYADTDFPDEEAQIDGTLMHAIERSWLYVAKANGYNYQIIRNLSDNRPFDN